jgi:hypothetical protein
MTFRERTIHFDEEIERIEHEREELAAEVAAMSDDNPLRAQKAQRGTELDAHLDGLEWARDTAHEDADVPAWDEDVDCVTLAGLTGGEYGAMEGEVLEAVQKDVSAQQVERVANVRMGTVEAPYLTGQTSEQQETAAVASLPIAYLKWAGAKIDELSSVGNGDRRSFATLLAEKDTKT